MEYYAEVTVTHYFEFTEEELEGETDVEKYAKEHFEDYRGGFEFVNVTVKEMN